LFSASCLHAQNVNYVKGRVLEYETGKPVPYVNVYLSGTTLGLQLMIWGTSLLKLYPTGNYQMIASAIGYHSEIKKS
jgi:outer membrane receptor for ferrienterochelin and colicins